MLADEERSWSQYYIPAKAHGRRFFFYYTLSMMQINFINLNRIAIVLCPDVASILKKEIFGREKGANFKVIYKKIVSNLFYQRGTGIILLHACKAIQSSIYTN